MEQENWNHIIRRCRIFRNAYIHSKENFLLLFSQISLEFPLSLFTLSKILGGLFSLINRVNKWQKPSAF